MSLDDDRFPWHGYETDRRLDLHDIDAGSESAEEAMYLEGLAKLRAERPWEFVDRPDLLGGNDAA